MNFESNRMPLKVTSAFARAASSSSGLGSCPLMRVFAAPPKVQPVMVISS